MMYFYICDYFGEFKISNKKSDGIWFECEEVIESEVGKRFKELLLMGYEFVQ